MNKAAMPLFLSDISLIINIFKDTVFHMCCCLEAKLVTAGKEFTCSQCFGVSHKERSHSCSFSFVWLILADLTH